MDPNEQFRSADWEDGALRLASYARRLAHDRYGWCPGKLLPGGSLPEDIAGDAYAGFANGDRTFNPNVPMMVQLRGAVRSKLSNLHRRKENSCVESVGHVEVGEREVARNPQPNASAESAEFTHAIFGILREEPMVKRSVDLKKMLAAVEGGAESVAEIAGASGLTGERVSELRRQLKEIFERVKKKLKREGVTT